MIRRRVGIALVVWTLVATASFGAGASTHALFVDAETTGGTIGAASSFGYTGTGACIDTDENGRCNPGDPVVDPAALSTFHNASADLIIPADVGDVYRQNDPVSITAGSITAEVEIESFGRNVDLRATTGDIRVDGEISSQNGQVTVAAAGRVVLEGDVSSKNGDVTLASTDTGAIVVDGRTIASGNGDVILSTDGDVRAAGATLTSNTGQVSIAGETVDITGARLFSKNRRVRVRAGGRITADRATFDSKSADFSLRSGGKALLQRAAFSSQNGAATVELPASATLAVEGLSVMDGDDTLAYRPAGATVRGSPARGSVAPG